MKFATIPSLALSLLLASTNIVLATPTPINGDLPSNLITTKHHHKIVTSRQTGSKVDTTPTCVSDPDGFVTMADARSCLDEIAAKGTEQLTIKAPGGVLCERTSGKFWAGIGGDKDQSAAASDIAAAGKRILDTCKFNGVRGMLNEMTGGGAYVATNDRIYVMFSKDEQDD
ncbi:hypothetical protein QBC45DRAFT_8133 [Copromyces sp. CBS 386.78]|nr:hypothetical protein QBC45DRAFT_8133 [Copromyces sp. CBS 386.78]